MFGMVGLAHSLRAEFRLSGVGGHPESDRNTGRDTQTCDQHKHSTRKELINILFSMLLPQGSRYPNSGVLGPKQ